MWADCLGLIAASLALYVATLAPTVLWGDDATFQLAAAQGQLQASAGSHPLWVAVASLATRLPLGELAHRVNLVSAGAAALTVGLLYLVLRSLRIARSASLLATVTFAVSHTFWAHAVRAEVYTLALATLAALVLAALRWQRSGAVRDLVWVGLALGAALTAHMLALLYVPGLAWLVLTRQRRLDLRAVGVLAVTTAVSLTPLSYLLWRDSQRESLGSLGALRWALLTFQGFDFGGRLLQFSAASLASDVFQWAVFLGYQFVGLALPLGLLGAVIIWRRLTCPLAVFVGLLYTVSVAFAFSFDVGDRYVFYLPSYLAFIVWVGFGIEWLTGSPARAQSVGSGRSGGAVGGHPCHHLPARSRCHGALRYSVPVSPACAGTERPLLGVVAAQEWLSRRSRLRRGGFAGDATQRPAARRSGADDADAVSAGDRGAAARCRAPFLLLGYRGCAARIP